MNPTARDLLETALKAGGYDGLVSADGECSCLLGDLFPCGAVLDMESLDCIAGYKVLCPKSECRYGDGEFHVVAEKPAELRPEILPCPKCGSDRVAVVVREDFSSYVHCYSCIRMGPVGSDYFETVRLWNEAAEAAK